MSHHVSHLRDRIAHATLRALLAAVMLLSLPALAAPIVDDSSLVGSEVAPVEHQFTIAQAGSYQLHTTDLGFPAPLQSVKVAVTHGSVVVASALAVGDLTFDATPGTYKLLVAGIPAMAGGFGSFGIQIRPAAGGALVLDYSDSIQSNLESSTPGQSTMQAQFTVADPGPHHVVVADAGFPVALSQLNVLVSKSGVEYARLDALHPSADFNAPAGTYDLLAFAQAAAPSLAGLYTVKVTNLASGTPVYDQSHPVGAVDSANAINLPTGGTYSLVVTDLQFPQPLATVGATVTRGATILGTRSTAGSSSFDATAGDAQLFSLHVPATPTGSGASSVAIRSGTVTVFSSAYVESPLLSSGAVAVVRNEFQATAGQYRITLADFDFPGPLTSVQLAVVQDGQLIAQRAGVGTLDFTAVQGQVDFLTVAQPNAGSGSGLVGLQVTALPAGTVAYETTQAFGALFQSRTINVQNSGSYDLTLTDLGFPADFTEIALAATRGTTLVGSIFGGGKFSFQATPGTYVLNLIAQVSSSEKFGAYGVTMDTTPPPPVVNLSANPSAVKSGKETTLTWTSTGATSCTASDAWSGSKTTAGSQVVGPLTVDGKFTLTCTGPGGSAASSVTVTIKKGSSGGGGPIDGAFVLCCFLASWAATRRRPLRGR